MKKILMFVCLLIFTVSFGTFTEAAQQEVSRQKALTLTFNNNVDPTSAQKNIYVVNDKNTSSTVDVKISVSKNKVIVTPNPHYTIGDSYTLNVTNKLHDVKGKSLKAAQQKKFTIENACDGYNQNYDSTKFNSTKVVQITKKESHLGACTPYHEGNTLKFNTKMEYASSDINYFYEYAGETDAYYFIMVAGQKMFVDKQNAKIATLPAGEKIATYKKVGSNFILSVYRGENTKRETIILQEAPKFIAANKEYMSPDGLNFYDTNGTYVGTAYNYFQYVSLRVPTKYTAAELNSYLQIKLPKDSVMFGIGDALIAVQNKYNINALFLLAFAGNESSWGTSNYAKDYLNLFGYGIKDIDPKKIKFTSLQQNLEALSRTLDQPYLTAEQDWARGATIGSKAHGLNAKYSTDPYWGLKAAAIMDQIDRTLKSKDKYTQQIGVIQNKYNYSHFRPTNSLNVPRTYTHTPGNGRGITIVDVKKDFYEVVNDYSKSGNTVFISTENAQKVETY